MNGIQKVAALWSLQFFMKCTVAIVVNSQLNCRFESHECQTEGTKISYCKTVKYLPKMDTYIVQFIEPSNQLLIEHVEALCIRTLLCDCVCTKKLICRTTTETHSMPPYGGERIIGTVYDLLQMVMSIENEQSGSRNTNVPRHKEKADISHRSS